MLQELLGGKYGEMSTLGNYMFQSNLQRLTCQSATLSDEMRQSMANVISGTFDTRREAEMAVERFVQGHGIDRNAIRIVPVSAENSAGVEVAGADAKRGAPTPPSGDEAALAGRIEVSLDRDETDVQTAREVFEEFKATDINVG